VPHKRIVTLIRLPLTLCFLFLMALPAHAAEGATFTVDSGGIGISITQPWSLSTSAVRDEPDRLSFTLYDEEEGVIAGGGGVSVYPLQDSAVPGQEELRKLDARALLPLVGYFRKHYLKTHPEHEIVFPAVEEINGFAAIVIHKDENAPAPKIFSTSYYFSFSNKLVYLSGDVNGDDATGELFKRICASLVPQTSSPADMTTVRSNGMGLSSPRSWSVTVGGIISDPTWAIIRKEDENEATIAEVTVFPPVASGNVPTGMEERLRAEHNILGTNLPTKRITPLGVQQTTVGKFPASLTRVRVVVEDENDKPILVELRDIPLGDTTVTIATRHADTLSEKDREELGKELEALYASFTWTP